MNFILIVVMSSFPIVPKYHYMAQFDSAEKCEFALAEAKKRWETVNDESKCIDLNKYQKILDARKALQEAEAGK